jgi:hypothetical protein
MHSRVATLQTLLEGVSLPASKAELISYAQENGGDASAIDLLAQLPDREYEAIDEVGEALAPVQPDSGSSHALPRDESGEPPGGADYLNAGAEPGAVRHDAPPSNPPQKALEEQTKTQNEQRQRQQQMLDS